MDNVLIVDDDEGFLLSLEDLLKGSSQPFSVLTANNGKEASSILDSVSINLVVTDLKMPEMDGFDLLANISSAHPDVPVIVMTAYGTPEMENRLKDMGAFQYIEKPIDFNILLKKISDGLFACSKGHIDGISLPSFMQLLQLDKKTCTLTVTSKNRTGMLFFQQGELTNASTNGLKSLEAAMEISSWEQTKIEIINICKNQNKTIDVPLGFILIESARLKDERENKPADDEQAENDSSSSPDGELEPIPGVNLDNLDFDRSVPVDAVSEEDLIKVLEAENQNETARPSQKPPPPKNNLRMLLSTIDSLPGIQKMIVIAKSGKVLAKHNVEVKKFGNFIAYATAASRQTAASIGFSGPRHIIMNQSQGGKIIILPGPAATIGLELDDGESAGAIIDTLSPVLKKTKIT
ncbi:MAG: response regulator [Proteobacteria bacterium]|nr:response regulator [Pseudomonadota bacterium]MBU1709915.1 response regulator [Pseudomonadota bacterium]